jgi:hypothetical protein
MSAEAVLGLMTLGAVPHSGNPGDPPPAPVQVAAVLLIVQALIRVGFLLLTLFTLSSVHASSTLYRSPFFVIQAIGVPAAFIVAGLVAGILVFQRASAARPFGLVLCAVGLAYQLYAIGSVLYLFFTRPSIHLPWFSWVVPPAFFAVYLAGLVIFILWGQKQTNR